MIGTIMRKDPLFKGSKYILLRLIRILQDSGHRVS